MNSALWIITGTATLFLGSALAFIGTDGDGDTWALVIAWPVLYAGGLAVTIGTIAAGIVVARK